MEFPLTKEVELSARGRFFMRRGRPHGGWACVLRFNKVSKTLSGSDSTRSERRLELISVVEGLKHLKYPCLVRLNSGDSYFFEHADQILRPRKSYPFLTELLQGKAANFDLWRKFEAFSAVHSISVNWVPARTNHPDSNSARRTARNSSST